ncbi:MAG: VCBS repeat-containing protein [Nitrospirae bacterium]|nr:VCBS repeat-containing protein [Nitrospirota bacterium]
MNTISRIASALILISLFFFIPVITVPSHALSFDPAVNYGAGRHPASVITGEFNGDGKPDLAVANYDGNNVSVLLGVGNGTFNPAVNYGTGLTPTSVAIGEFNADGRTDLVVANYNSSGVSILLGNGDGTFNTAVNYGTGGWPYSVITGEFNADGRTDLAVASYINNNVSILLGNGDGTFSAPVNYAAGNYPFSITIGEFNADGRTDLAVANYYSNDVSILLGNGNGTFGAPVNYAAGSYPFSITTGEFNGDNRTDLAVVNYAGNDLSVLLGNGNGTFNAALNYGVGNRPRSVISGDFNNDNRTDLAVANSYGNDVSVLLGNGDGTFNAAMNYGAASWPYSVITADFNGDGMADLAAANFFSDNASILINTTQFMVTANAAGTGAGSVTSDIGGINYNYPADNAGATTPLDLGSTVVLTAEAAVGSVASWTSCTGAAAGNGTAIATCLINSLDRDTVSAARFSYLPYTLTVDLNPKEGGTVRGGGINCPSGNCSQQYAPGAAVTLTATGRNGYKFRNWAGCTIPAGSVCTMNMNRSKAVIVRFIGMYIISGKVTTQDGLPMPNVTMTLEEAAGGGQPGVGVVEAETNILTATDSVGKYRFTKLPNGSYRVAPGNVGFTFTPSSQKVTILDGNQGGVNFRQVY